MKTEIPLYATIPFFGNEWSVVYQACNENLESHASHSGYGDFPESRFPDIPLVDFRTANDLSNLRPVQEAYKDAPMDAIPLSQYLEQCAAQGATVSRSMPDPA